MELSVKNILNFITEEEIFLHYLGFTSIDLNHSNYCNPLRKDNKPGCNFKRGTSWLFFNDHAYPEYTGSCFHIVKLKHSCDFWTALRIINRDFKLGLDDGHIIEYTPVVFKVRERQARNIIRDEVTIKVSTMPFLKHDLKYWRTFGISKKTLELFNVKSVLKAWINDKYYHQYTLKEPMYTYLFKNRMKLYRPFSKKNEKWRSNCTLDNIQGLEQLCKQGDILIITKSLKDVMVLHELGFNAIAPQNETPNFDADLIANLKKRFKRIIVWYDNDDPGVRNSILLTEKISAEYFNIPKEMPKDPSDFLLKYEAEDLLELLLEKNIINEF
jgi:hypothetical protein